MEENKRVNLIPLAIVVVGVLIAGVILHINQQKKSEGLTILPPQKIGEKAIKYINENLITEGKTASLSTISEENGLYKIVIKIGDQEFPSYVTRDGKFLFPQEPINLDKKIEKKESSNSVQEIPKRDKPDVKLFVMSYCPYGLQMEKAYLPVYNLLKDKLEMGIYFVNYIMHNKKEIDENLRQYCIQKEEKEKYVNYLSCFLKAGEFEKCLMEAKIDKDKMNSCISKTDQEYKISQMYNDKKNWLNGNYPKFDVNSDLNEKYGVQGSPTIVINDKVVEVNPRSPEKFKEIVCQSFNSAPAECSQTLSENVFSVGFGLETGSATGGGCGK